MKPADFLESWPSRGENSEVILLDVREPHELALAAIDGAHHIPMGQIPNRLGELDPRKMIVAMCHGGVRSMQVAIFLSQQGFERVANLEGGIDAWSVDVDARIPRY